MDLCLEPVLASYESSRPQKIINLPLKEYVPLVWEDLKFVDKR